jgi:hypothetical protein
MRNCDFIKVRRDRSPMLRRYWIALFAWLAAAGLAAAGEMGTARVVALEEEEGAASVVLNAGERDGLSLDAEVTLLREAEPIVHPLTGEVLGVPQEPVGVVRVFALDDRQARGEMIKNYSEPEVGDLAEYERMAVLEERQIKTASAPEVDKVVERVKGLEKDMARYRKSQKAISAYPVFAQQVWDELNSVKSYLISLDERLIELETLQGEDRNRLNAVANGEYRADEMREFTFRYGPETDIRLQVQGKTLIINVERDSLHVEELVATDLVPVEEFEVEEEEGGSVVDGLGLGSLLDSPYLLGGSLLLIVAVAGAVYFVVRRRYNDVMGELGDFDEEYMEEEEEEEEEDEF